MYMLQPIILNFKFPRERKKSPAIYLHHIYSTHPLFGLLICSQYTTTLT